jgi:hypothetical protein
MTSFILILLIYQNLLLSSWYKMENDENINGIFFLPHCPTSWLYKLKTIVVVQGTVLKRHWKSLSVRRKFCYSTVCLILYQPSTYSEMASLSLSVMLCRFLVHPMFVVCCFVFLSGYMVLPVSFNIQCFHWRIAYQNQTQIITELKATTHKTARP